MEEKSSNVAEQSPDKLLSIFLKGHIVYWSLIALAVHVALIGGLSLGYIRDRWIDPAGAAVRLEAEKAAQEAIKKEAAAQEEPKAAPTNAVAAPGTEAVPQGAEDSPMVKSITDKATPAEIPAQPEASGISLDDVEGL